MTDRLKPCPFCGGDADLEKGIGRFEHSVVCQKCRCKTRIHAFEEDAIKKWNTRKPMDRIVERLEAASYEYIAEPTDLGFVTKGRKLYLKDAIEIIKEEANE